MSKLSKVNGKMRDDSIGHKFFMKLYHYQPLVDLLLMIDHEFIEINCENQICIMLNLALLYLLNINFNL